MVLITKPLHFELGQRGDSEPRKFHQEVEILKIYLLENFRHLLLPTRTGSECQESGGRGWEVGWGGLEHRTWRTSSWTVRRPCCGDLGSSCPSGWSTGARSSLPSRPSQLRTRKIDRRSLEGRSLRSRNVSSLTLSTTSGSSSGCSLSSEPWASTPGKRSLMEMFEENRDERKKRQLLTLCSLW